MRPYYAFLGYNLYVLFKLESKNLATSNKPFPRRHILDSSKLKEFADDNFQFDERVENTVGKGEIVAKSNFSFSHSVFKRIVQQTRKNQGLFGKGLIFLLHPQCFALSLTYPIIYAKYVL